jgi:peptidoglycan/xylan/chitin deacetylase (PgdA/CDA1 family)
VARFALLALLTLAGAGASIRGGVVRASPGAGPEARGRPHAAHGSPRATPRSAGPAQGLSDRGAVLAELAPGAPAAAFPAGAPPARRSPARARYRIVGCRSRGGVAYTHGPTRPREVAIGFDDGPAADTGRFVAMLERAHARATFFLIGRQVGRAYRATMLRELRDGDVLGDHSFSHPDLTRSGDVYGQLRQTIQAIRAQTGYTPCVFRPPYGAYDRATIDTARSLGLATVLWSVDPSDYATPGTAVIEQRVLAAVRPGAIILSHDGGGPRGQTLAAYPSIIGALRRRGYRIVTIPQLLGFRPLYVRCVRLCDGIGIARRALPRGAIIKRAP